MEVFMDKNKLFNSMNYINQEWVEQAKPTRNKRVSLKKNKKYKVYRNIAAAAAVVFAVSGITYTGAYAYQKYLKPQSNVNFSSHIDDDSTVSIYSSNNMENSKDSTVDVIWGNYVASGSRFYVSLTFKSKDGSPIIPNDESDMKPIIGSFNFEKVHVSLNGNSITDSRSGYLPIFFNGMSEDGTEIYAEMNLDYNDGTKFVGSTITISTENLRCAYATEDKEKREERQIATGEWSFETQVEDSSTGVICSKPDVQVPSVYKDGEYLTITDLESNGFEVALKGTGDIDFKYFGVEKGNALTVTLKNGTVVEADTKLSDLSGNAKTKLYDITYGLKKVVAVEDIDSIEWHGATIYKAE